MSKPTQVKPSFYAYLFEPLKEISKKYGYNLVMNGSLNRDFDLIAIGWQFDLGDKLEMIQEFDMFINGKQSDKKEDYLWSVLPPKRQTFVININRGGAFNDYQDKQYYLDISIV